MLLNNVIDGDGEPVLLLHGLLGSLQNFNAIARELSQQFQVIRMDLRNHGASGHDEEVDYVSMADDVAETLAAAGVDRVNVVGHSMGGKVAMQLALSRPRLVESLCVVDIAPVTYSSSHDEIFAAMNALPLENIKQRKDADSLLSDKIPEAGIRQFVLTNLSKIDGGYRWRINLPALTRNLPEICSWKATDITYDGRTMFLYGDRSDYMTAHGKNVASSLFPNSEFRSLSTGHWVHAEAPKKFLQVIHKFLDN